jgi:pimeloyl-ACP methyl ester carboxylesterase
MAYLEVEGDRRIYFERHRGSGRPVVLVHGWGVTARCWDTVAPALRANGNEVVLLDLRACGRSDKDFDDVSIAALGSDVAALVERLGLREPVLNGWSAGGAVVTEAAAQLGGNLSGLVQTGGASPRYPSAPDWPHGGTPADVEAVLAGLAADRATTLKGVAEAVCARPVSPEVVNWMWGMFLEMGPRADDTLRDLARVDQRKIMDSLDVPVLLLHGERDPRVSRDQIEAIYRNLAGPRDLYLFEGLEHDSYLPYRPEEWRYAVLRFLESAVPVG